MRIFKTLRKGGESAEIRFLQRTLPAWAWANPINASEIDGKFGSRTEAAVKVYQKELGLADDGIAGKATCSMLDVWADTFLGVDVSDHQGDIDWASTEGIQFAFCKASEGKVFQASTFEQNYRGARAHGLWTGAYHFARGKHSAHEEAQNFLSTLVGHLDMPPALDVESQFALEGAEGLAWVHAWLEEVTRAVGGALLYTSTRIVHQKMGDGHGLDAYRIWYPRWGSQPRNVLPWPEWDLWQYTNQGDIPGISGPVDLNRVVVSSFL